MADKLLWFKYVVKNVAFRQRQDVDLHAEAALRRQRLRHALPPVAVEDGKPLFAGDKLRGLSRDGAGTSAASSSTPGHPRLHQPDDQQLPRLVPATKPRSTSPTRRATARPRSASRCTREPEGQAHRVPLPRPVVQPLPRLRRHADGRPRRHPEPHRAGRRRSTRTSTTCRPKSSRRSRRCRLARGGARRARGRPRVPAQGRRVHQGPDRDLDRLQALEPRWTPSACARSTSSTTTFDFVCAGGASGGGLADVRSIRVSHAGGPWLTRTVRASSARFARAHTFNSPANHRSPHALRALTISHAPRGNLFASLSPATRPMSSAP
jgi:hypothetical protein